ncbi:MAG: TVP38/TMEM64 family protein [Gemmataceae bacterium]
MPPGAPSRTARLLKLSLLLAFVAGAILVFRLTPLGDYVTIPRIRALIDDLDSVSARLAYVGVYIAGTVLLLPGTLLSFVGAVLFGAWEGTLYTWIGATIGATLAFFVARGLGRGFVESMLGERLAALDRRLRDHGFTGLLILRLVPLFPFNALNFGCGLTALRTRDYVLATAIGILPGTFVYQFLFAKFGEKILREGLSCSDLWDPTLGLALGLFVVFVIFGKVVANRLKPLPDPSFSPASPDRRREEQRPQ